MSDEKATVRFHFDSIGKDMKESDSTENDTDYHAMNDQQQSPHNTKTQSHDVESMIQTPSKTNVSSDKGKTPLDSHIHLDFNYNQMMDNAKSENNSNSKTKHVLDEIENNPSDVFHDGDNQNSREPLDAFSIASTILTADGIVDQVSFRLNCLIVFLGDMARGIFFPTMWNLVQSLGGDQVLLGYVIASFSFGRMIVLPLFGSWSIQYGYKWTLQVSTLILFIGTILFAQTLNVGSAWFLIFANTVVGVGSGTLGVTMAYASEVTPKRKRTGYLAWVAAVQYAGTTATPFLGSLFVVLFAKEEGAAVQG